MTGYAITFARSARKELETLPRNSVARIVGKIEVLATAPRPAGCRKLQGAGERTESALGTTE